MEVNITQDTKWIRALNAARRTVGKEPKSLNYEPSDKWKRTAIMAEHSPIKLVEYCISFKDLRQWVGVHLLRHEHVIPQIHTQRVDRRNIIEEYPYIQKALEELAEDVRNNINPRDFVRQGEKNNQDFYVNAQTLINISRRRLCNTASKETVEAWKLVVKVLKENVDPIIADFLVPNCIYRGFCPEMNSCGYWKSSKFKKALNDYRNLIGRGKSESHNPSSSISTLLDK